MANEFENRRRNPSANLGGTIVEFLIPGNGKRERERERGPLHGVGDIINT